MSHSTSPSPAEQQATSTAPRTVAIVTGASRGLGLALTQGLLSQGAHVMTIARQAQADEASLNLAAQAGVQLKHLSADLGDPTQWPMVAQAMQDWLKHLSQQAGFKAERYLLINNAGSLGPMAQFDHLGQDAAQATAIAQTFNLNIGAVIHLSSAFVQAAEQLSKPSTQQTAQQANHSPTAIQVINISSGAARNAYPGWAVYCASKAALDRYSEVLQVEAPFVKVVSIAPGVLDTAMQVDIRQTSSADFPNVQRFIDLHTEQALSSPTTAAQQILAYSLSPDFGSQTLQDIRLITP